VRTTVTIVLLAAGILVIVATAVRALAAGDDLVRVHYLSPATSLGVPLVGLGIAITAGWTWTTATVALVVVLLAVTSAPLSAAIASTIAEQEEDA
jgi:multicomponent Na+:H+ antiporter subunit G